jgi:uncharacterized membrane protein YciS (DUF1049 family)
MSGKQAQNLKNHASFDPWFHVFLALVLVLNLINAIVEAVRHFTGSWNDCGSLWGVVFALSLFVFWIRIRTYPLKVQDRVIRLEERLRLKELGASKELIAELSEDQLIGLRFASDDELPALAEAARSEKLNRKQIKERIRNWRADHWRV